MKMFPPRVQPWKEFMHVRRSLRLLLDVWCRLGRSVGRMKLQAWWAKVVIDSLAKHTFRDRYWSKTWNQSTFDLAPRFSRTDWTHSGRKVAAALIHSKLASRASRRSNARGQYHYSIAWLRSFECNLPRLKFHGNWPPICIYDDFHHLDLVNWRCRYWTISLFLP